MTSEDSSESIFKKAMNYSSEKYEIANKIIDKMNKAIGEKVTLNLDKTYKLF